MCMQAGRWLVQVGAEFRWAHSVRCMSPASTWFAIAMRNTAGFAESHRSQHPPGQVEVDRALGGGPVSASHGRAQACGHLRSRHLHWKKWHTSGDAWQKGASLLTMSVHRWKLAAEQ